jgi:hypothetical protein
MKITRTLGVMVVVGLATAASLSLVGIQGGVQILTSPNSGSSFLFSSLTI